MLELTRFRLAPTVEDPRFLAADRAVQTDFAYHRPGLLRRTTARGADGTWLVVELWRSDADADAAAAARHADPACRAFDQLVAPDSLARQRFVELD